jgi:hypothetical protein
LKVRLGSSIIYLRRALDPGKKRTKGLKKAKAGRQVPGGILELKMSFRNYGPAFPGSGDILEPYEGNGYPLTKR